ncbi:RsfA family transcriptional regulator [Cytobacillus oceanisediminis]|uniref:RsfA family transcriptional regulator n=1 Tax=Cytobacillus oceanisediminis TaxID=665099 RepID=UPI00203B6772|nr:RsfA family transcriptional regulator [Cytobacillus oceanisediminis]MCM3393094.1 RsfA family transcriptional regulator [Cytobacillus oceanisediminis]
MTKTRQDAWTGEEDELLANVVLSNIRNGGTQLKAFEEVGKQLSRTASACGFRWNACVRRQYKEEILQAKTQRKELAPTQSENNTKTIGKMVRMEQSPSGNIIDLQVLINNIDLLYKKAFEEVEPHDQVDKLKKQVLFLTEENQKLSLEKDNIEKEYNKLKDIIESSTRLLTSGSRLK